MFKILSVRKRGGFIIYHTSKTTQEILDRGMIHIDNGDYDNVIKEYNYVELR